MIGTLSLVLAVIMCSVGTVNGSEIGGNPNVSITSEPDQYPEYTSSYNTVFVSGVNGWGEKRYQTGGISNFWRSRAITEVVGDHGLAVSEQDPYAYAEIRNKNTGSKYQSTASTMNDLRSCVATTSYINPSYATYLKHTAKLKINGVYNWPDDQASDILPE